MLRLRERTVLGGGGWIDDGGAAMAVAGGNEDRGEIVAEQCDIDGVAAVGDRKRASGTVATIAGLPLQGGKVATKLRCPLLCKVKMSLGSLAGSVRVLFLSDPFELGSHFGWQRY